MADPSTREPSPRRAVADRDGADRRRLQIVSHFPGRLRVRAPTFRVLPEVAERVARRIREEAGVLATEVSPVTGSLVVEYDPRRVELPRLVEGIAAAAALRVAADSPDEPSRPWQGARVRRAFASWNDAARRRTGDRIDLRTAVPGALAAGGLALLLAGRRRVPEWYDLAFWAFVTFSNLNPRAGTEESRDAAGR